MSDFLSRLFHYIDRRLELEGAEAASIESGGEYGSTREQAAVAAARKQLEQSGENMLPSFARALADALANHPTIRLILSNTEKLIRMASYTQEDLDNVTAELKQAVADTATRIHDQVASLQQTSPTFNADVQSIKDSLVQLAAIAPAPGNTPAPTDGQPDQAQTTDAHPEIVKPADDTAESRPENTDQTPQVQKDMQPDASKPEDQAAS
jgi:ABC-type transporter Mla subunit MlaD